MKYVKLVSFAALLVVVIAAAPALAGLVNGGFETGDMTGWTSQYYTNATQPGEVWTRMLGVTNAYHHSGNYALSGYAYVKGDTVEWPEYDQTYTYAWSGYQDLTRALSVSLYLAGFNYNANTWGWGYGQEIYVLVSDGTKTTSQVLIDHHQDPWGSLFDAGKYTTSAGTDGRTWYRFEVSMNDTGLPGVGDHSDLAAKLSDLNLTNARVGVLWEALNWAGVQELWAGSAVDDIDVSFMVPEPASLSLLALGGLFLLPRKRE